MSKALIFIFIASIFLMNSFGIGSNLYPLRLVLPIVFVFFFTVLFQKVFLLKQKVKFAKSWNKDLEAKWIRLTKSLQNYCVLTAPLIKLKPDQ